jgi:hypothetical protein
VLYLVQDGVDLAIGDLPPSLTGPVGAGVEVWADEFSVAQRALLTADLAPGVTAVSLAKVVDLLLESGVRAVWH